ncbi:DUF6452 family protein [Elizabethkingia miricola]|uniref:DUF6452 family protein n=1 Tax=Elizabethkingia miricola TaxID=172045 RepID=UPI000B35EF1B|nr:MULTISPECIES: DUF6452 family protein [Elizabethkingia]NHQ65398.1 hypothetical protein [Elizabethkingia miricola]NHQ70822.1 hypothetical protein [Elizabethkingia miricola]NHQ78047.1 hypothetical protein [Elizabethkingia miricola]PSL89681.1 hypothetical protein C7V10_05120 [Elizabethkingia miricola]QHQ87341.1 hypothetical protein FE632_11340 [Elizabethkingia miricola]
MKYIKFIFCFVPLLLAIVGCNQEDDICTEGGSPKMKVKFKRAADGKLTRMDSLTVRILWGTDTLMVAPNVKAVDSVMIPLKVTGDGFTDILVQTNPKSKTDISKIKVKYTESSEYVSPGCGIRKLYDNLTVSPVEGLNPVKSVDINSNQIHNEVKTVLYFNF